MILLNMVMGFALLTLTVNAGANEQEIMSEDTPNKSKIEFEYLSNEGVDPYLVQGKAPRYETQQAAAAKFPSVLDCLLPTERDKESPDLRLVDWPKMRSNSDAINVCVFRIMSSLRSKERCIKWLESQDLKVRLDKLKPMAWGDVRNRIKAERILGSRFVKNNQPKLFIKPNNFGSFLGIFNADATSESISVFWSENGKLVNVSSVATTK